MKASGRFAAWFVEDIPEELRPTLPQAELLDQLLADALDQARKSWPEIRLAERAFLGFLAERIASSSKPGDALRSFRAADLYLACACVRGDRAAIAAFERSFFCYLEEDLAQFRLPRVEIDDLKQELRQKLFVGDGCNPPKLTRFSGSGGLRNWMRVVAIRQTINSLRTFAKEEPLNESKVAQVAAIDEDHELRHLKRLYRREFKLAFQEAFRTLSERERNLLRHAIQDDLSFEEIGAVYRVHQTTVTRWISKVRKKLFLETRSSLTRQLKVSQPEFESIIRLIQSQLDVSMRRLLKKSDRDDKEEAR